MKKSDGSIKVIASCLVDVLFDLHIGLSIWHYIRALYLRVVKFLFWWLLVLFLVLKCQRVRCLDFSSPYVGIFKARQWVWVLPIVEWEQSHWDWGVRLPFENCKGQFCWAWWVDTNGFTREKSHKLIAFHTVILILLVVNYNFLQINWLGLAGLWCY